MQAILDYFTTTTLWGMTVGRMGLAFLLILAGFALRRLLASFVNHRLAALTSRTATEVDDLILEAIRKPIEAGVVIAGIGFALIFLQIPTEPVDVRRFCMAMLAPAITLVATWLLFRLIDGLATHFKALAAKTENPLDDALIPLLRKAIKVFLGLIAFIVAIQNMGYSVTGLIAGLGVGGLALALAAKDTLANLFGSIMILLDRPFRVGDWIKGADFEGTVEEIGFRSTRVRTFPKTLVSIPNSELANTIIDNHQEMPVRRMLMDVGVTYDTTAEQMRAVRDGILEILAAIPEISPDGVLVRFAEFGGSSLNLQVRCFTHATGYDQHMEAREQLLLRIMEMLAEMGLEIAFPSQTIYFGKDQVLKTGEEECGAGAASQATRGPEA